MFLEGPPVALVGRSGEMSSIRAAWRVPHGSRSRCIGDSDMDMTRWRRVVVYRVVSSRR
jgi:hypothetical protein